MYTILFCTTVRQINSCKILDVTEKAEAKVPFILYSLCFRLIVKITGEMVLSFPAGITRHFSNNPAPAALTFRITNYGRLEHVLPNPQLLCWSVSGYCIRSAKHGHCWYHWFPFDILGDRAGKWWKNCPATLSEVTGVSVSSSLYGVYIIGHQTARVCWWPDREAALSIHLLLPDADATPIHYRHCY